MPISHADVDVAGSAPWCALVVLLKTVENARINNDAGSTTPATVTNTTTYCGSCTGTTVTTGCSQLAKRYHRRIVRLPVLLNRHHPGTPYSCCIVHIAIVVWYILCAGCSYCARVPTPRWGCRSCSQPSVWVSSFN